MRTPTLLYLIIHFLTICIILFAAPVFAASEKYQLDVNAQTGSPQMEFTLGYTLGTHVGKVVKGMGRGYVQFDPDNLETMSGEFLIPIEGIRTGNDKRDCHLRESLGLNYGLAGYPGKHVCNSENLLPLTGDASIHYPYIRFFLKYAAFTSMMNANLFSRTGRAEIQIYGAWEIHGIKKNFITRMKIEHTGDGKILMAQGNFPLQFADFGIKVKPARVLGVEIGVKNQVMVNLNLHFSRQSNF